MHKQRKMIGVKFKFTILLLVAIGNAVATLDIDWWKHTIMYEIYISSFKDSNGDGVGDIKGITTKLDHFVDIGVETIYITPFFRSPMEDLGYDISNYTDVDPLFGSLEDFDELVSGMEKRGLKLIMDFVINHSSDEHPWFNKSINRIYPYTNFYVWADPKGYDKEGKPIPPNNWFSVFLGSMWEWNEKRRQFYLHQFGIKQPDFNLRCVELKQELKKMLKFWIDKGVSGFRLDAAKHFIEDDKLRDEPLADPKNPVVKTYDNLKHIYTTDLWETYEFIHELREYIDQCRVKRSHPHEKILIVESYTDEKHLMAYYGTEEYPITHFPFNFVFVALSGYQNASSFDAPISHWLKVMPKGATPNWVAENHDTHRMGSKLGEEYMDLVTITIMTLPGVACLYYGEEIGMTNSLVRKDQRKDPNSIGSPGSTRDGERLPMQWDDTTNAGFTSKHVPWLPVNPNYWRVNVEAQKIKKNSRYNMFKTLSRIRTRKTMKSGDFKSYIVSEWVYAFTRSLKHHETYITILNLGTETELVDLHDEISYLPATLEVGAASINAGYFPGDQIRSVPKFPKLFPMRPLSGIVLTTRLQKKSPNFGMQLINPRLSLSLSEI